MAHSFAALACLPLAVLTGAVQAQAYPSKPITVVVGFAAGGPVDLETRSYATKATDLRRWPPVTSPRPGRMDTPCCRPRHP
jgi:tripartite-type tricarboxylate transporter receptor subunit TctC